MYYRLLSCCCCSLIFIFFFFFSSRRRHTRCSRDWSSDVCSSDLGGGPRERHAVRERPAAGAARRRLQPQRRGAWEGAALRRSEEHTSELQSRLHLVCRLLLEKKKKQ